ncbi:hypothetical protein Pmani_027623 [Petrolisthes manimaculis]|uniref:Uncharacterized protein n=1 Tax=Petrolisthes manimaculis TaxID=1843537 RepID=A0AAE1P1R0_9EUCA|nr:hypothetical protein Pmani_027623 [Petrolisthes manimaculis]
MGKVVGEGGLRAVLRLEARQYLSGGALPANTPRRATSTSTLPPLHLSWHSLGLCCDLQVPPRAMYTLLARPLHLT